MDIYDFYSGWIQVVVESVLVGSYTLIVSLFIQQGFHFTDWNLFLFVLGFFKHVLGYLLGIQDFYCRNGYACQNIQHRKKVLTKKNTDFYLHKIVEALMEGFAFVIVGNLVSFFLVMDKFYVVFATGFLLHIIAEMLGIHTYFCESCKV